MLGNYLRDVIKANPLTFRVVRPDETISNRGSTVFKAMIKSEESKTVREMNSSRRRAG